MSQNVRYATSRDGVRIDFTVEGEGPALVVTPYFRSRSPSNISCPLMRSSWTGSVRGGS
jgi:hypothetical protein